MLVNGTKIPAVNGTGNERKSNPMEGLLIKSYPQKNKRKGNFMEKRSIKLFLRMETKMRPMLAKSLGCCWVAQWNIYRSVLQINHS